MPSFSLSPLPPFPPQSADFPSGTQFQDETVNVGPTTPKFVSFNGPGVQATYDGAAGRVNVEVSAGAVEVMDEGTVILPAVRRLNFVGAGVTASVPSGLTDTATITIPGGGGGSGVIPLVRAKRESDQTSGAIATYETGTVFSTGFGTLNLSTGIFTPTAEGVFYFTAVVPINSAAEETIGGVTISVWPDYVYDVELQPDQLEVVAAQIYVPKNSALPSRTVLTVHSGPVYMLTNQRAGVVHVFNQLCGVSPFSTSSMYIRPVSSTEGQQVPCSFSVEYFPYAGA